MRAASMRCRGAAGAERLPFVEAHGPLTHGVVKVRSRHVEARRRRQRRPALPFRARHAALLANAEDLPSCGRGYRGGLPRLDRRHPAAEY
jgi:hypothetical protein